MVVFSSPPKQRLYRILLTSAFCYRINKQELSYHKQIARQLCTQYVEVIYRSNYPMTLKSRLRVTQGHCERTHWIDHTRLSSSHLTLNIIVTLKCRLQVIQGN